MEINDEETDALRASACACPDQEDRRGGRRAEGGPTLMHSFRPPVDCAVHGPTPPNLRFRICQELMGQAISLLVPLLCWATRPHLESRKYGPFTVLPPVLRVIWDYFIQLTKFCSASNGHILPHEITRGRHADCFLVGLRISRYDDNPH